MKNLSGSRPPPAGKAPVVFPTSLAAWCWARPTSALALTPMRTGSCHSTGVWSLLNSPWPVSSKPYPALRTGGPPRETNRTGIAACVAQALLPVFLALSAIVVGRAILPAAAFQAAFSGQARILLLPPSLFLLFSPETHPQLVGSSSQHRSVAFQAAMPTFFGAFFQVSHPIPPWTPSVA